MQVGRINKRELDKLASSGPIKGHTRRVADAVRDLAADLAPVLTGGTRRSLTVEETVGRNGLAEFRVGWDPAIDDAGPHVELGTEDTPPQPHLRPAAAIIKRR